MKVAHFLPHFPSPGGTTSAVRGISGALARLGCDVSIWTYVRSDEDAPFAVRTFEPGVLSRYVPPRSLRRLVRAEGKSHDLVVLHGMFNPQISTLAYLLAESGVPYVVCPHGTYHPGMLAKRAVLKRLYRPIERRVLNDALAVHVFAESHLPFLRKLGVTNRAFIVPNGVEPFIEAEDAKMKSRSPRGRVAHALFFGRIDAHQKGLDLLLHALTRIPDTAREHVMLTLIGPDAGDRATLQALAERLSVAEHVRFAGPEYRRWPQEIIRRFDFLILPSRFEGFPMAALEAMSAGRPLVVSQETGIDEHIRVAQCGVVCPADVGGLAAAIEEMMQRRGEWDEMGRRGREYVREHLTWDALGSVTLEWYRRLLA